VFKGTLPFCITTVRARRAPFNRPLILNFIPLNEYCFIKRANSRLNGARRARTVVIQKGKVPLNTISARIDYGFANSMTIYSTCSVKVWFYF
jgi:hypothetical protein